MEHDVASAISCYCRACGAPLEVRVGFKGKLVWPVEPASASFGETEPQLQGDYKDPRLVCSADVLHKTGFRIEDGVIVPDPSMDE